MIKRLSAGVMVFAVGLAAVGCGVASSNGPETDAWGNPIEDADSGGACAVPSGPAIDPNAFDPTMHQRPAQVLPGNAWIVIEYEVRALPQGDLSFPGAYEFCVPIDVHVYVRPGESDVIAYDVNAFEPGPFDFSTSTPWTGRYITMQYDPTDERFEGRPPSYEIHLQAKYAADRDLFHPAEADPSALSCRLKIDGAGIAYDLALMPARDNVECTYTGNTFHAY